MTKTWLRNYPNDVAHKIDLTRYSSLIELFHQTVYKYGSNTAYNNYGAELSFEQVDKLSRDFACVCKCLSSGFERVNKRSLVV